MTPEEAERHNAHVRWLNPRMQAVHSRFPGDLGDRPLFSQRRLMAYMPVWCQYLHWRIVRRLTKPRRLWPLWRGWMSFMRFVWRVPDL